MQKNALASRTLEVVILILCNIFRHMSDRMWLTVDVIHCKWYYFWLYSVVLTEWLYKLTV
jgi:hypothetical protein